MRATWSGEGIGRALRMDNGGEWRSALAAWLKTPDARRRLPFLDRGWVMFHPPKDEEDFDRGVGISMDAIYGEWWHWWFPRGIRERM
jgi:hypothetical protein